MAYIKNENLTKGDIDKLVIKLGYTDITEDVADDAKRYNDFYKENLPIYAYTFLIPATNEVIPCMTFADARRRLVKEAKQEYVLENINGEYFVSPVEKPARELKMHTLNAIVHLEGRQEEARDIRLTSDTEGYLIINDVVRYVRKDTVFYTWYEIFPVPQTEEELEEHKRMGALNCAMWSTQMSRTADTAICIEVLQGYAWSKLGINLPFDYVEQRFRSGEICKFSVLKYGMYNCVIVARDHETALNRACNMFPSIPHLAIGVIRKEMHFCGNENCIEEVEEKNTLCGHCYVPTYPCTSHFCIGIVEEEGHYCEDCVKQAQETLKPFDVFVDNVIHYWRGIDANDAIYSIVALLDSYAPKTIEAYQHYESKADLFEDGYQRLYAQTVAIKDSDYLRRMTVFSPDVPNGTGYMMFNGEIVPVRFHDRGWYEVGLSKEDADKALSEYPVWEDIIQAYSDFKSTEHAEKWWNSTIRSSIL